MPIIPELRRLRQEDCKFKDSLDFMVRFWLKIKIRMKKKKNNTEHDRKKCSKV
jgi:hypothetical protein